MRGIRERVALLRGAVGQSEITLWPTCLLCTTASSSRTVDGSPIWIPVEGYRRDPPPGEYSRSEQRGCRGYFDILAECHGDVAGARIHVPYWWGNAHEMAAIRELMFFGQDRYPDHGIVTSI